MNFLSLNVRGFGSVGKPEWVKGLVLKNKVDFLCIQESMLGDGAIFDYASVWGNGGFDSEIVGARGKSGGFGLSVESQKGKSCMWMLIGDFNTVRWVEERNNSKFNSRASSDFNHFIDEASLQEWHGACLRALPRELSDHTLILLTMVDLNYGAKPFRWFDSWLDREGCEEVVKNVLQRATSNEPSSLSLFKKLAAVKLGLKSWWHLLSIKEGAELEMLKHDISRLEAKVEEGELEDEEVWIWEESKKEVERLLMLKNKDLKQKARVKWASMGDDNSTYFHRCINGRKASNSISGVMVNGDWIHILL
ncbi:uncharacterized protein LOC143634017 [Bidens hawaiensis]|uniref:uncharacterized protein LOC143634017 n=1 Tax=Bidens hawaiensis TaxID=980011 RepID=UPI0040497193